MRSNQARWLLQAIVFYLSLGVGLPACRGQDSASSNLAKLLDPIVREQMELEHVPGASVAVVKDGSVILLRGYGFADVETQKRVDPDHTVFRIGSTSKALTGLALLQLADQGKIDLNEDVNRYLKRIKVDDRFGDPVTSNHLLTHTAGFDQIGTQRLFFNPEQRPSLEQFLSQDLHRIRPPGRDSCYDTYGIALAGHLVSEVSGMEYSEYMRKRFFEPLGMTRSWVETPDDARGDMATGYSWRPDAWVKQRYEYYATTPASSIDSTSGDMARLMVALLGDGSNEHGRLFSASTASRLSEPQYRSHPEFPGFANGMWEMFVNDKRVVQHGGVMQGYYSGMYLIPEEDLGVFIVINRDPETGPATQMVDFVFRRLMDHWFPQSNREERPARKRLDIDTTRFAGNYVGNLFCHTRAGGRVWRPGGITSLRSTGPGTIATNTREYFAVEPLLFEDATGEYKIAFHEDAAHRICSYTFNLHSPGNTMEKLDERLLEEVLGPDWKNQTSAPLAIMVERLNREAEFNAAGREEEQGTTTSQGDGQSAIAPTGDSQTLPAPAFILVTDTPLFQERASTGGISWIDFDADGDDDAFVTNGYDVSSSEPVPQKNILYENQDGAFIELENELSEASGFSSGSAWGDFDNDGLPDVFIPNQRGQNNFIYRNAGNGSFQLLSNATPSQGGGLSFASSLADIDADGFIDLYVANGGLSSAERDFLFRNTQGTGFELLESNSVVAEETRSGGATFVDYDLDGDLDLYIGGDPVRMYRNDGTGNFKIDTDALFVVEQSAQGVSYSGAWGDFDNDGDFDLFQAFTDGQSRRLYVNDGNGSFARARVGDATADVSFAFYSTWVDLNNDGFLDLVVANWGSPPDVYLNSSGVTFKRMAPDQLGDRDWYASMVAFADYDQDGDYDLVVGNWPSEPGEGEANLLYGNEGPVGNSVSLRLQGTVSNRSAIGARVQVSFVDYEGKRHELTRDVRSQDGWRSQSSLELLFGIGTATRIASARIYWPSGIVQDLGPIEAGERRTIIERSAEAESGNRESGEGSPGQRCE